MFLKALTKWPTWKKLLLEFIAGKIGLVRLLENQETGGVQTEHPEGRVHMWGTAHFSFTSHLDSRMIGSNPHVFSGASNLPSSDGT